jgi:hypothetical protein
MTIKSNIRYLKALVNNRSPTRSQQEKIVKKYEERKIANKLSAENLILKLQNSRRSVVDKALKELEKYEEAKPVTGRINRQIEEKRIRLNKKTTMVDKLNKEQELEDEQNQPNIRAMRKRSDAEHEASKKIANNLRKFNQPRTKFLSYSMVKKNNQNS